MDPIEIEAPLPSFVDLGLSPQLMKAIKAVNYVTPSPIQAALIPRALSGADCIGQARTGTGKTAAFVIPILERIDARRPSVQALVLTPTRELSEQVAEEARRLSNYQPVTVATIVGGKQIRQQVTALQKGAQIVVGTPGRVIDLMTRRLLSFDTLRLVVLDEADRMLDIGFRPDIEKILRRCPEDRQTLLLSATLPPPVERLAQRFMRSPERIDLSTDHVVVHTVEQFYIPVEQGQKFLALVRLLVKVKPRQAIVFCRTKRGADHLYEKLSRRLSGISIIHGDLAQSARDRAMRQFRSGEIRLLIATDVVGRGIDVSGVSHIINYDVPEFCDDYVHRVGRTGRLSSGDIGMAFTLVTRSEGEQLTAIEKRINKLLDSFPLEGIREASVPHPQLPTSEESASRPEAAEAIEDEVEDTFGIGVG